MVNKLEILFGKFEKVILFSPGGKPVGDFVGKFEKVKLFSPGNKPVGDLVWQV